MLLEKMRELFSYFSKPKKSELELEVERKLNELDQYTNKLLSIGYFNPYDFNNLGGVMVKTYFSNIESYIDFIRLVSRYHDEIRSYPRDFKSSVMLGFFTTKNGETFIKPREEYEKLVLAYREFKELMIRLDTGVGMEIDTSYMRQALPVVKNLENFFNTILQYT